MDTIYDYAVQIGLKPHKVPLYKTIYYGILHGYAVTLFQFYYTGAIVLCINTDFRVPEDRDALNQLLLDADLKEKYHMIQFTLKGDFISFQWKSKDLNDFITFVEWFFPLLPDYHATNASVCTECGKEISEGTGYWCHMNSSVTKYVHKKCCGTVARKTQQLHAFFPYKKLPTYKAGILGSAIAILPAILIWAYVFRFAEAGVIATSILIGTLTWTGYTLNAGFRGILKPFILLGITFLEFGLGALLLPLFGSISALPLGSTDPYILIFISCIFACFLILLIWSIEAIFYANETQKGFYGIRTWKNKK